MVTRESSNTHQSTRNSERVRLLFMVLRAPWLEALELHFTDSSEVYELEIIVSIGCIQAPEEGYCYQSNRDLI